MHLESNSVEVHQRTFIYSEQQHVSTGLDDIQRSLPPYFFPWDSMNYVI